MTSRLRRMGLFALALLAIAAVGAVPAAQAKKKKTRTVTRTATFNQCVSTFVPIIDPINSALQPAVASVPVTVPTVKGKTQDGTVTAFNGAGVRITHTFDGDISLFLISPGGKVVTLSSQNGAAGDGYGSGATSCAGSLVTYADAFTTLAQNPGNTGNNPIVGSFKPETSLAQFVGGPARGPWTLLVLDFSAGDTGSINAVSLNFTYSFLATVKAKKKKK